MKEKLTKEILIKEAQLFCIDQSQFQHKELPGIDKIISYNKPE